MKYEDWVRGELKGLSKSLGFRYTPQEEVEDRLARLRSGMERERMEAFLVVQKMDCYYLSGTTQDSLLLVPLEGKPLLMVRREVERARVESPLEEVVGLGPVRELPSLIGDHWGRLPQTLGLELDVLPVRDYFRYQDLFPGVRLMDASPVIRDIRKIKSPFEVELMRVAGEIGKKVYQEAREIIKEGMTEIEFGGLLEAAAKRYGHEGLLRVRSLNYEACRGLHLARAERPQWGHCEPVGFTYGRAGAFASLSRGGQPQGHESPRAHPCGLWNLLPRLSGGRDPHVLHRGDGREIH